MGWFNHQPVWRRPDIIDYTTQLTGDAWSCDNVFDADSDGIRRHVSRGFGDSSLRVPLRGSLGDPLKGSLCLLPPPPKHQMLNVFFGKAMYILWVKFPSLYFRLGLSFVLKWHLDYLVGKCIYNRWIWIQEIGERTSQFDFFVI